MSTSCQYPYTTTVASTNFNTPMSHGDSIIQGTALGYINPLVDQLMHKRAIDGTTPISINRYVRAPVYSINNGDVMQIALVNTNSYIPIISHLSYREDCAEAAMLHISKEVDKVVAKVLQHAMQKESKSNMLVVTREDISNSTIHELYKRSAEMGYPCFKYLVNRRVVSQLSLMPHQSVQGHFSLRDDPYVDIALFESDSAIFIVNIPDEPVGDIGRADINVQALKNYATTKIQYLASVDAFCSVHDTSKLVGAFDAIKLFEENL